MRVALSTLVLALLLQVVLQSDRIAVHAAKVKSTRKPTHSTRRHKLDVDGEASDGAGGPNAMSKSRKVATDVVLKDRTCAICEAMSEELITAVKDIRKNVPKSKPITELEVLEALELTCKHASRLMVLRQGEQVRHRHRTTQVRVEGSLGGACALAPRRDDPTPTLLGPRPSLRPLRRTRTSAGGCEDDQGRAAHQSDARG